ncbi:DUF6907 domain-containing protein [Streptomyces stramineus]|uniref:Uncharacterized protein n=1 Tax=Streptomyces stramineus TaxID=173861 RepID=A0ABN0ZNS2_9ACTN
MSNVLPSRVLPLPAVADATVPVQPSATPPPPSAAAVPSLPHPSVCPSWCKDRRDRAAHTFGPTSTSHWGSQYRLANPFPGAAPDEWLVSAELYREDTNTDTGYTTLYVQGVSDAELEAPEVDALIAQAEAFVATLRVLRRQMG